MIDYEEIKCLAKEQGITVDNLLALAPKNDPFYTGRPNEVKAAEWFAEKMREIFGDRTGVHLRRLHYRLLDWDNWLPDGTAYENTDKCWKWLCEAGKWARYLGLVGYEAFVDRRNPDAIINAAWHNPGDPDYKDPTPCYGAYRYNSDMDCELPGVPELKGLSANLPDLPSWWVEGYISQQPYHIEVWCEKTSVNDVLKPLCEEYRANLITSKGELSITSVVDFMGRVRKAERSARILYVSDYDPAGLGMPISIARKIEFLQGQSGARDLDIRLEPVVLTADQVAKYHLPRKPVKDSETRKGKWEERHGEGAVELDALEGRHEGELRNIIEAAILEYHDPDLEDKTREKRRELVTDLFSERRAVLGQHGERIGEIKTDYGSLVEEMNELQGRFTELVKPFQEEIDQHREQFDDIRERWRRLVDDIADELGEVEIDLDDYALPEPDLPEETDTVLYASERDYLEQLEFYQTYREGGKVAAGRSGAA